MSLLDITSDNGAHQAGFTLEVMAWSGACELHLSIEPDADLDGDVLAFDHDEQEMIKVHGWMFEFEEIT